MERVAQGGRVVIGVRKEKTASVQIALTKEEETVRFSTTQTVDLSPPVFDIQ